MPKIPKFQSTHPLRGATRACVFRQLRREHFNPRTPCGVRHFAAGGMFDDVPFQSTHPLRGATCLKNPVATNACAISIHAPLAGCDSGRRVVKPPRAHFNPRTPCGVRPVASMQASQNSQFQSTHPLRGATFLSMGGQKGNPISIHAPLAGCDTRTRSSSRKYRSFQSTHPLRGATFSLNEFWQSKTHFNPRTPCGVRLNIVLYITHTSVKFQSTHPLRGATGARANARAPRENFNPRTPCGVRRKDDMAKSKISVISIHAPLAGCDLT